jgi:biotin carboxyl carrier protein
MPEYFVTEGAGEDEERSWTIETIDDETYRVVTPDGEELEVEAYEPESGKLNMLCGRDSHDVDVHRSEDDYEVVVDGRRERFEILDERQKRMREAGVGASGAEGPELVTPMAGTIVDVTVDVGTPVEEGETVVIVEAMKMENDLQAHRSGVMSEVHVEPGESVDIGDALVSITEE